MAMNGIDISPWQESLNLLNVSYDFVMIKATEGVDYVSPTCDMHFQEAKSMGKKRAVYGFTNFGDPIQEADYFVDNTVGYIRDAIPVLDWEGAGVGDVGKALTWLRRVRDRYGYNSAIYMSEWVENHYDWSPVVAEGFGLIIAKYSDYEIDNNYDMSNAGQPPNCVHWDFYFMWQWTSKGHLNGYAGDLDCDIAYLSPEAWDKYAGVQAPAPQPETTTTTAASTPEPTTTTTTGEPSAQPAPNPYTTTTTTTESPAPPDPGTTSTTTTQTTSQDSPVQGQSLVAVFIAGFVAAVLWIFNRLRGEN
jgi:lysozyme